MTDPCIYTHAIAEIIMARKRLEKTQNVADGNFPDGFNGVGSYVLCMMSSCIIPHITYENCNPKKHNVKSHTVRRTDGLAMGVASLPLTDDLVLSICLTG